MNKQQIFDTVVRHLIKQGHPAIAPTLNLCDGPMCMYRAPNGDKCAFGVLISDEVYTPNMENIPASTILGEDKNRSKENRIFPEYMHIAENTHLISRLQYAHDTWENNWVKLRYSLATICEYFDLNGDVMKNIPNE